MINLLADPTTSTPTQKSSTTQPASKINLLAGSSDTQNSNPTVAPQVVLAQSHVPPGGVKVDVPSGNEAYRTPSGSIMEFLPDGTKQIHLAAQFGGGSFNIDSKDPNKIINTGHTTYGGLPPLTGNERDDIIPVSLGGVNANKDNIRYEPTLPKDQQAPGKLTQSDAELQKINSDLKSGKITLAEARLKIMTYKNDQTTKPPKAGILNNLVSGLKDIVKEIFVAPAQSNLDLQKSITEPSKPKPTFGLNPDGSVADTNLTPEQKQKANVTVIKSSISEQNRQAMRDETGANGMDIGKTTLNLLRAPVRGLVQITNPSDQIEPLNQGKLFRFVYGDEPLKGYSLQAAEAEQNFKDKGFGKLSTPLAVLQATGNATLDLAPIYAPLVSAVNEELASAATKAGTKTITLSYKDLQDITSGKVTSGEKFDAFKAVGKDLNFKNLQDSTITKTEDTLAQRMAQPIQKIREPIPTEYQLNDVRVGHEPLDSVIKQLPAGDPIISEVNKIGGTKMLTGEDKLLALPEGNPNVKYGDGFSMTDKTNKEIVTYQKALNDLKSKYNDAVTKFNKAPTPTKLKTVLNTRSALADFHANNLAPWEKPAPNSIAAVHPDEFPISRPAIINEANTAPETTAPTQTQTDVQSTPVRNEPTASSGNTPSKIGRSIEQKAVENRLTRGFEGVAGYDKITIADQAQRATKLFENPEEALKVIKGETKLPEGLRGTALITAAEDHILKTGDAKMAFELANSPLVSETSAAAQELRLAAERAPDSLAAKLQDLKKTRENAVKEKYGSVTKAKAKVKKVIKSELAKNPIKPKDFADFIETLKC